MGPGDARAVRHKYGFQPFGMCMIVKVVSDVQACMDSARINEPTLT